MYGHGVRGRTNLPPRSRQGNTHQGYPPQGPSQLQLHPRHPVPYQYNNQSQHHHYDNIDNRQNFQGQHMTGPRGGYINGKNRGGGNNMARAGSNSPSDQSSSPHEECMRFVLDAWLRVTKEMDHAQRNATGGGPVYYREKQPGSVKGFQPVDLEKWKAESQQL